jgi:hypothetical protein
LGAREVKGLRRRRNADHDGCVFVSVGHALPRNRHRRATGEFIEEQIYNWTYTDEQREKREWTGLVSRPYEPLDEWERSPQ